MKALTRIAALALFALSLASGTAQAKQIWSEEFNDGTVPDPAVWSYDLGNWGWGNQELQNYTDSTDNVRVEGGNLVITARQETNGEITSGRIRTQDKLMFQYGTVEARIKVPDLGNGLWPAFWTLGNNFSTVSWPWCGEIDVLEMGHHEAIADGVINRRVYSTAHWDSFGIYAGYGDELTMPVDLNDDFHIWRLEWTSTEIRTYIDGQQIWVIDTTAPGLEEFNEPHFFILNMAVGGMFTGITDGSGITAPLPAQYLVDYVRIYDNGETILSGVPPRINELRIDQSGSDVDEYFELKGQPSSALDGLTYIVVGDGSGGSGVVESISDLSGLAIPADGVFLAGENSMSIAVPDATMTLGFENSDNVTHMLVSNFTGTLQEDLDFDDDGVFDVTPWDAIIDSVSLVETPTSGDQYYSSNTVGPDGTNVPGHAVFCDDTGWQIGGWDISSDTAGDENNCSGPIFDCNSNGVEDSEDISAGTSSDCDLNGVPDECDPDCGTNGVPDACEPDCDTDGTPDDCEVDSDNNGVPDDCEIVDCNNNSVDDATDIATGTSNDCDANGVPDECEILDDCNENGVADACDISSGTSDDANGNGVPDECKGSAPAAGINEIRVDQSGSDNDEYVELSAAPGTVLDGLTYIVIGDGSAGAGAIECALDITGTVGSTGIFLIAEDTFTLNGVTPDQVVDTSDYTSSLAFENGDNVTHMLVYAFGGAFGDDVDADDDGTMDNTPWLELVDGVALIATTDTTDGDYNVVYSPNQVGPNGDFMPAHVYKCGGAWSIGDFGLGVDDTPGTMNYPCDPSIFVTGLRSPMGMDIASDGSIWVAQAGSGGADPMSAANDAGVARIDGSGAVEDVVAGMPSITAEGFAVGCGDVTFDYTNAGTGDLVVAQMGGADPLSFSALEFNLSAWTSGSAAQGPGDVTTQWDIQGAVGGGDSNPYGVAVGSDGNLYVVDSGANAVIKCERSSGTMSVFATFPDVAQPDPVGPPFTHSVPTRILAHDDGFYVVNLTGFPFNDGAASVFDVDYSGNVTELATGLSRVTDVALDPRDGSLYVTQFTSFDVTASPPWVFGTGTVARVTGTGAEVVANVTTPTGIAIADDGTMYVSSLITGLVHRYESTSFPGVVYCSADAAACPCGNGGDGTSGCANSTGAGGTLSASGSPSLSNDTLVLEVTGLAPNQPCLFFSGANRVNGGAGIPFGDGLRCAGFQAVRIQVVNSDGSGEVETSVEVSTNGQAFGHTIEVGETVNYQAWYRDNVAVSPCGSSFNTTNGYSLRWDV